MENKKLFELAVMGVQSASKILNVNQPEVYFASGCNFPNTQISSIYRYKDNEIIFNEDWINRSNALEIMITTLHETRHAYQKYCIETESREDETTLEVWEKEFKEYNLPTSQGESKDAFYLKQSIEIDAIAFARYQMKNIYGIDSYIPNVIKNDVEEYIRIKFVKKV